MKLQELFSLAVERDNEKSLVTVTGVVPKDKIEAERAGVLAEMVKRKKIDGFREGHAPAEVVERAVGSLEVWRLSAREVIERVFPEILAEEKLTPLGSPQLQFTAIADRADASFRMVFYLMPEVVLPDDYLSALGEVAVPSASVTATDEDVNRVIVDIRRSMYADAHPEQPLPEDENALPDLTDAYIQSISKQHANVPDFLEDVRNNITEEKRMQERAVFRQKMLDAIIAKTTVTVPEIVVAEDAKRMYDDFTARAEQFGTTVEKYLAAQNLSEEQLQEQMRADAKKRAAVQFTVNAISAKEHIHASEEDIASGVAQMKQRGGNQSDEQLRVYVESFLTHEAVMRFLEEKRGAGDRSKEQSKAGESGGVPVGE